MTGFAARSGAALGYRWNWEIRSVNARGLDLRLRLPDWIGGLEQAVRGALSARLKRGNIALTLKLKRDDGEGALEIDDTVLAAALAGLKRVEEAAVEYALALRPPSAAEIVAMPGILRSRGDEADAGALRTALLADLEALLTAFGDMRASEGQALEVVLRDQLAQIEDLLSHALEADELRADQMALSLRTNLTRVLEHATGADEARVAQELAMIAVKSDVREELDRLEAHVVAARELLSGNEPKGRKLDFLMQEFNREANTLCSKAQSIQLTRIGLDLKAVIDQMREQAQNVE